MDARFSDGAYGGFILGMKIAERLNNLPDGTTIEKDGFAELLQGVADGSETLFESAADIRQQYPQVDGVEESRAIIDQHTMDAARCLERRFLGRQ